MKNILKTLSGFIAGIIVTILILSGITVYATDGEKDGALGVLLYKVLEIDERTIDIQEIDERIDTRTDDMRLQLNNLDAAFRSFSDDYASYSRLSRAWMECQNAQCIQYECINDLDCSALYDSNYICSQGTCVWN